MDEICCCGYLMKRVYKKRGNDEKDKFRKRWVELRGTKLLIKRHERDKKSVGEIELGLNAKVKEYLYVENSFKVKSKTFYGRFFCFQEIMEETTSWGFEQWIESINKAISKARMKNSVIHKTEYDENFDFLFVHPKYRSLKKDIVSYEDDFVEIKLLTYGLCNAPVMKVRSNITGHTFAVKRIKKETLLRENMVERTTVEKDVSPINYLHPFLVPVFFVCQTKSKLYFFMEFSTEGVLFFKIRPKENLGVYPCYFTVEQIRFYAAELTLALSYLQKKNFIYRDLTPANLILGNDGHLLLTGVNHLISRNNQYTTFCGTPEYLAPEILKGEGHDKSVDWWCVGILMYEMLTGLPPFYSENINDMYMLILEAPLTFPKHFFVDDDVEKKPRKEFESIIPLIRKLLIRDVNKRIKFEEIITDDFFKDLDWKRLKRKDYKPPSVFLSEEKKLVLKDLDERILFLFREISLKSVSDPKIGVISNLISLDVKKLDHSVQRIHFFRYL